MTRFAISNARFNLNATPKIKSFCQKIWGGVQTQQFLENGDALPRNISLTSSTGLLNVVFVLYQESCMSQYWLLKFIKIEKYGKCRIFANPVIITRKIHLHVRRFIMLCLLYSECHSLSLVNNVALGVKQGVVAPLKQSVSCIRRAHLINLNHHAGHAHLEEVAKHHFNICTCIIMCIILCVNVVCACMCVYDELCAHITNNNEYSCSN